MRKEMKVAQIRRQLRKGCGCAAERALRAVLEMEPYDDKISAAYTAGAKIERKRVVRVVESAFNDSARGSRTAETQRKRK